MGMDVDNAPIEEGRIVHFGRMAGNAKVIVHRNSTFLSM
jgi:hypothetical protein